MTETLDDAQARATQAEERLREFEQDNLREQAAETRVQQLATAERTAREQRETSARKVIKILFFIAFLFLVGAIVLPYYQNGVWTGPPNTMSGILKTFELLLIVACCACLIGAGGVKITSSEAGHMEWLGTAIVATFAGLIAIAVFAWGTNVDQYADYRYLVAQRSARALATKPEIEYDFETGILDYKVEEHFLWVVVNIDYFDEHPIPRESEIFFTYDPATEGVKKGFATYTVREKDRKDVKRIAVFYGTGNGPSSEEFIERPSLTVPTMSSGASAPSGSPITDPPSTSVPPAAPTADPSAPSTTD